MSQNWKQKVTRDGYSCVRKADFKTQTVTQDKGHPTVMRECTQVRNINLVRDRRSKQLQCGDSKISSTPFPLVDRLGRQKINQKTSEPIDCRAMGLAYMRDNVFKACQSRFFSGHVEQPLHHKPDIKPQNISYIISDNSGISLNQQHKTIQELHKQEQTGKSH